MTLALLFWILMLLALLVGGVRKIGEKAPPWSATALTWFLFLILGWAVFGAPIR